jgi:NMD protein affecting ribosome stability and mRNA decay
MRKAILALSCVLLLASFANDSSSKTILKDIDGTLLQSYVVIDNDAKTVTFTVDANTTVNSTIIDGEFRVFLVENSNSGNNVSKTLNLNDTKSISFDHYMESNYDVASNEEMLSEMTLVAKKPKASHNE